jgi:hypothetical protein
VNELEAKPPYGKSAAVTGMSFTGPERIIGTGDMWPLTWADDDNIYAAAGDNSGFLDHFQPMNFWKVEGTPPHHEISLVNDLGFITADGRDPESDIPPIKPAGVVSVDGVLYLAVEDMRYTEGRYGNQVNLQAWMLTSKDHGLTWSEPPRPGSAERAFLTGVFASPHFLQFGRDYSGAPDEFVYAYSSAGDDGVAAWSAGDCTYLARVPRRRILDRAAWEFHAGLAKRVPRWSRALEDAAPVFSYPRKTGENEVVYHPVLRRYLLLNWAFIDCANHMFGSLHSELSVFESEHPWGPWSTVHVCRDWGQNCDYQPRLPTKWIDTRTGSAWLVSAGNFLKRGGRLHYAFVAAPIAFNTGDYGDVNASGSGLPALGDFAAVAISESEVHLSWLPVQGAGFYRVTRDGKKGKDIPPLYPSEFIDKGLGALESHHYMVTAFSTAGTKLAESGTVSQTTLAKPDGRSLGVNFGTSGFVQGTTVWCAEKSGAHFNVSSAWVYIDDRIRTLTLSPDPAGLEPALRSFRGGVPGVKVTFREPPGRRVDIRVLVVEPHLSRAPSHFEVWVNGVLVERYESSMVADANWCELGPFAVTLGEREELVVEGRHFAGLGGIAAIKVDAVEEEKRATVVD